MIGSSTLRRLSDFDHIHGLGYAGGERGIVAGDVQRIGSPT